MTLELRMNAFRAIVLIAIMVGLSIVPVLSHNFVTGIFNSPQIQENLKNSPLGREGFSAIFSNYNFYSYAEWYGGNYNLLSIIAAIIISFPIFAREKERKTIYLISGRRTRWEIFSSKVLSGYILTAITVVTGGLFYYIFSRIMGFYLDSNMVMIWTLRVTAGSLLFFQIGAYTSMIFSGQVRPILLDIAIYAGLLTAGAFKQTKFLDFPQYMTGQDVLVNQSLGITFAILLIIALAIFVLQYLQFRNVDL
ncbi:MAG: hypothetical protein ACP5F2_06510 [Athalassotoga sp.]|uniref:hypothetical protein n=1 Tax=Athalassotoga sp. TaxID=2022597 RepID=UPI003CFD73EE